MYIQYKQRKRCGESEQAIFLLQKTQTKWQPRLQFTSVSNPQPDCLTLHVYFMYMFALWYISAIYIKDQILYRRICWCRYANYFLYCKCILFLHTLGSGPLRSKQNINPTAAQWRYSERKLKLQLHTWVSWENPIRPFSHWSIHWRKPSKLPSIETFEALWIPPLGAWHLPIFKNVWQLLSSW